MAGEELDDVATPSARAGARLSRRPRRGARGYRDAVEEMAALNGTSRNGSDSAPQQRSL